MIRRDPLASWIMQANQPLGTRLAAKWRLTSLLFARDMNKHDACQEYDAAQGADCVLSRSESAKIHDVHFDPHQMSK